MIKAVARNMTANAEVGGSLEEIALDTLKIISCVYSGIEKHNKKLAKLYKMMILETVEDAFDIEGDSRVYDAPDKIGKHGKAGEPESEYDASIVKAARQALSEADEDEGEDE